MKLFTLPLLLSLIKHSISIEVEEAETTNADNYDHTLAYESSFGIIRSILNHRDFASRDFVKFSEWKSPKGELYVIPTTDQSVDDRTPAFGLGYKFINEDETTVTSSDITNVLEIREENITAAGFPFKWFQSCEEEETKTADDFFPFGSRKFLMIGVNKESVGGDYVSDFYAHDHNENSVQLVTQYGLFNWFSEEEDDCNADEKTNTLFDTDHFFFVGVASVEIEDEEQQHGLLLEKRAKADPVKTVTKTTTKVQTTTVFSIISNDNVITTTIFPSSVPPYHEDEDENYDDEIVSTTNSTILTTTNTPFVFNPISESSIVVISSTTSSVPETTTELSLSTVVLPISKTESDIASSTTGWSVPETWNSYPFTATDDGLYFPAPYKNSTIDDLLTSAFASNSTSSKIYTASFYGNTTLSKSTTTNGSIYTKTKVGNLSVVTSSNVGNNVQNGYWASVSALVFAVLSGAILI